MTSDRNKARVLLIDEWGAGIAIRIACDLARAGMQVQVLREFAFNLPLPRQVQLLAPVKLGPQQRYHQIDKAVKKQQPDFVMPLFEETLYEIYTQRPSWLMRVVPQFDTAILESLQNKHLMLNLARECGALIPETWYPRSTEPGEITGLLAQAGLPAMIKGSCGSGGEQVRLVESESEAILTVQELTRATGAIPAVQSFIDGQPVQVGGCFGRQGSACLVAGIKTEIYPPATGPAIALTSFNDPKLFQLCRHLMDRLGYHGIGGLDFVRARTGKYYFLEVNPRVWGSYGIAGALGVDLFSVWLDSLTPGKLCQQLPYPENRSWRKMPEYLFVPPIRGSHIMKRLIRNLAFRDLSWHQPLLLLHELRRIAWKLRA